MSQAPGPLGLAGVHQVPAGQFNLADFVGKIARPGTTQAPAHNGMRAMTAPTALVMYDSSGSYGWIGSLYAYQIGNLLSHFGMTVTRQGVENYKSGQLKNFNCAFYLGTTYYNTLPSAFMTDFMSDTKPFCWMEREVRKS